MAKARVGPTPIVLQPELRVQLPFDAVIPVTGHISIGIMTASVASDQRRRQDDVAYFGFVSTCGSPSIAAT